MPKTAPLRSANDAPPPYQGRHHARFHQEDLPYHIISRISQGFCLLVPTRQLNELIVGVTARALELYTSIDLYGLSVLSNHLHAMLSGAPHEIPVFIGFIKREISQRWGPKVDWQGGMWDEYVSTALPTPESQIHCLRYVLSQGVKEGLVARPQDWPGVHAAKSLLTGEPLRGTWLDGTGYGKALYKERQKRTPRPVDRSRFERVHTLTFEPIPPWGHHAPAKRLQLVQAMVADIVAEGCTLRRGRAPLGVRKVLKISTRTRRRLPRPPWFEERRRMIFWAAPNATETRAYLDRYWDFQRAYRTASAAYRAGDFGAAFPPGAFRPMLLYRPPPRKAA